MVSKCVICNTEKIEAFSLGSLFLSNFIPMNHDSNTYPKSDLTMMVCPGCGTGSLKESVNPDVLYKKYWYYSGINQTMKDALLDVVNGCISSIPYGANDIWLDIASNDGTLLRQVPDAFIKIGIDPSDEDIQKLARQTNAVIVNDYFSKEVFYKQFPKSKAKIITCIAMFYDLPDPHQFLDDVREILDDEGLFVAQISYTPLMFHQSEFGNVCAEHVMYYSLDGITKLFAQHGLYVVDCELNDINGGSFRVYCTKTSNKHFRSPQKRDVAHFRLNSLITYERSVDRVKAFKDFGRVIQKLKYQTLDFVDDVVGSRKTVYAYGASTKGNTLLQYFGLTHNLITKIADRNPAKWGLKTIGTDIPICSEEEMRKDHPDYLLILPWHFIEEFKVREHKYLSNGGRFIVPCPEFTII